MTKIMTKQLLLGMGKGEDSLRCMILNDLIIDKNVGQLKIATAIT